MLQLLCISIHCFSLAEDTDLVVLVEVALGSLALVARAVELVVVAVHQIYRMILIR